jgi:precorrin-4/cobalt-precorrin-4 C11-methyltransferase
MRVYFVGAGPGDPKLLTLRAAELIENCPVVLYTGSLVPREIVARARSDARVVDSSSMTLDEILGVILDARVRNEDVARVHTGDPLLFASTAEQMRRLDALGIDYEIVPGVSSFTAAAAAVRSELTLPEVSQTVILARAPGRTRVPERESLSSLAAHQATMALFLSTSLLSEVVEALTPQYGPDCPVAVVHRATWPSQKVVRGTLADIVEKVRAEKVRSNSIILVGRVLDCGGFPDSRLYDPAFSHSFRRAKRRPALSDEEG